MRHGPLVLSALLVLAGCASVSESRFNPMNWFGTSREERIMAEMDATRPSDGRRLIQEVVALRIDRTPGGAIIKATGLAERQAYYDAELVPLADEKPVEGVLEYQFRIRPPVAATQAGPAQTREVVVARFVSDQTLEGVRTIRVVGASNALVTRR